MTRPQRPPRTRPSGGRALDASMSLLNQVLHHPVEPEYAEVAARRAAGEQPPRRPSTRLTTVLVAVALGLVTTAAVTTLRVPAPTTDDGRALLTEEIATRTEHAEEQRARIDELSVEVSRLREAALEGQDPALVELVARHEAAAGSVPVRGPGLRVVLEDPEPADGTDLGAEARVHAVDLKIVTNALWAAGAEAVAINGERLTSTSAIRGAGQAILVDLAPLVGPYVVEAIGDVRDLQTGLARSTAGSHLAMLEGTYGVRTSLEASSSLTLPAGSGSLRHAHLPEGTSVFGSEGEVS